MALFLSSFAVASPLASAAPGLSTDDLASPSARTAQGVIKKPNRKTWVPPQGGAFNVPRVGGERQLRLEWRTINAINHAHKGSTIKMAMFSFDRVPVAEALIRARKRGVNVQVIVNGHEKPRAQRMLRKRLGPPVKKVRVEGKDGTKKWRRKPRKNFFMQCRASCRGDGDVQHSKFVLFTKTGRAKNVVMMGSLNMKWNGVYNQFNDLLTLNNKRKLHAALDEVFDEMRKDKVYKYSYRKYTMRKYQLEVMPFPRARATKKTRWTPRRDPIMKLLRPVRCRGAKVPSGRTAIRVNMHAWDNDRGKMIASRLRDLYAQGCDVKIHVGFAGAKVRAVFANPTARGRVPFRSTGYDTKGDGQIDLYSHAKILLINGHYAGKRSRKVVVTGSSNFQHGGQYGDELIFRAYDTKLHRQYVRNWSDLWSNHTHGFHWGRVTSRGAFGPPSYMLDDGLGTDSEEWRDK